MIGGGVGAAATVDRNLNLFFSSWNVTKVVVLCKTDLWKGRKTPFEWMNLAGIWKFMVALTNTKNKLKILFYFPLP
ncbi:hypothetical protein L195_g010655 [Trifolium pratense]|uniref:Uncharacterized protein n=1 Tax=Trifolium pratense TaxID=57577 RepID=A0A2K3PFB6_TRIPR|nr:hypothetical protein L195_g010655 [Trifolium pratense]